MTPECQEHSLIHATSLETILLECLLKLLFIVAMFAYQILINIIKSLHIKRKEKPPSLIVPKIIKMLY